MFVEEDFSLKDHHTFHLDVRAQHKVSIIREDELEEVFRIPRFTDSEKLILGGGSNLLFSGYFLGLVIKMEIKGIKIEEDAADSVLISFGAGENWHQCVEWCIERGFGGIENLSLIPGTIGAAPMQNIGAYGVEIKEVFHSLEAYEIKTGTIVRFYNEDCKFGYRYSVFKGPRRGKYIITKVYLRLSKEPKYNISYGNLKHTLEEMGVEQLSLKEVSQAVIKIRQSKLPNPELIGNAGSFFKNPIIETSFYESIKAAFETVPGYPAGDGNTKIPAAWLIDQCGWKGYKRGEIGVHKNHPLVLVNYGGGKGIEIIELSKEIQDSVFKKFGIRLEPEVNMV